MVNESAADVSDNHGCLLQGTTTLNQLGTTSLRFGAIRAAGQLSQRATTKDVTLANGLDNLAKAPLIDNHKWLQSRANGYMS